jgi:serine/threonine protein kinase
MSLETGSLAGLVASVADGWPQDWHALEASDHRHRASVRKVRVIADIAAFHRTLLDIETRREDTDAWLCATGDTQTNRSAAWPVPAAFDRWGRFRILEKLGEGGYGEVYRAHDMQLDREVALKLVKPSRSSPSTTARLLDEARMLARVRHPNVATVYGAEEHDDRSGLWMELIRGVTLEQLLRSHGPMSAGEAAVVGQDLCRALAAVHAAGLIHRDVKTTNVMRETGGRIVLMDFGTGAYRGRQAGRHLEGTPPYVAPEVYAGAAATVLSDIYSLGVLLFRLVSGAYPCDVGSLGAGLEGRGRCVPLRELREDLPDAFTAVVEHMLLADPSARARSAGAVRAALGAALGITAHAAS